MSLYFYEDDSVFIDHPSMVISDDTQRYRNKGKCYQRFASIRRHGLRKTFTMQLPRGRNAPAEEFHNIWCFFPSQNKNIRERF